MIVGHEHLKHTYCHGAAQRLCSKFRSASHTEKGLAMRPLLFAPPLTSIGSRLSRRIAMTPSNAGREGSYSTSDSNVVNPTGKSNTSASTRMKTSPNVNINSGNPVRSLRVCRVCKRQFDPVENGPRSCRHHTQSFSGRLLRVSPTDTSDLQYFYDCCGATDPHAPGCSYGFHQTYD